MAMPWAMTFWMAKMVWLALTGWVSSCLTVADEVAGSIRTGDIGAFHAQVLLILIGGYKLFQSKHVVGEFIKACEQQPMSCDSGNNKVHLVVKIKFTQS
ncbi:hypothetical protein ACE6H2_023393 [Prunus campanulata]